MLNRTKARQKLLALITKSWLNILNCVLIAVVLIIVVIRAMLGGKLCNETTGTPGNEYKVRPAGHPTITLILGTMRFLLFISLIILVLAITCEAQRRRRRRRQSAVCKDVLPHCEDLDCRRYGSRCKKTCSRSCKKARKQRKRRQRKSKAEQEDVPPGPCVDMYREYCPIIAENNWCKETGYKGKCCLSCTEHEKNKDPRCFDEAQGCAYYKEDMCTEYPEECKKTCGLCTNSKRRRSRRTRRGSRKGSPKGYLGGFLDDILNSGVKSVDCLSAWSPLKPGCN